MRGRKNILFSQEKLDEVRCRKEIIHFFTGERGGGGCHGGKDNQGYRGGEKSREGETTKVRFRESSDIKILSCVNLQCFQKLFS